MTATSQLVWQLAMAELAKIRPMEMTMGAGHHRREETHNALGAKGTEQGRQHRIEQAGAGYAQAGVGQKLGLSVGRDCGITSNKGKR